MIRKTMQFGLAALILLIGVLARADVPVENETQKLRPPGVELGDLFGSAVAVQGETAVVGAIYGEGPTDAETGNAYIFTRNASGAWEVTAEVGPEGSYDEEVFGDAVAIDGDTVLVGAPGAFGTADRSGAGYIYARNAQGGWTQQARLVGAGSVVDDRLGYVVGLSGDTAVLGGYFLGLDANSDRVGAYVFERDAGGHWTQVARLRPDNGAFDGRFGQAVAVDGDTIVVGAPTEFGGTVNTGSAYVFERTASGGWRQTARLRASDATEFDLFGVSVALDGNTLLVGSYFDAYSGVEYAGSVYVFARDAGGTWVEQQKLTRANPAPRDFFGETVALDGDTAVIGTTMGQNHGAGHVFTRDASGWWTEQTMLVPRVEYDDDNFGRAISVSDGVVWMGALTEVVSGWQTGSAYVFDLGAGAAPVPSMLVLPPESAGGAPMIAVLRRDDERNSVEASVVEARPGGAERRFHFFNELRPVEFLSISDRNGNGSPELLVVSEDSYTVDIRDSATGEQVKWYPLRRLRNYYAAAIDETNDSLAILARHSEKGWLQVAVMDVVSGTARYEVFFNPNFDPVDLLLLPDRDGDGKPEFAVLGKSREPGGPTKVEVRNARGQLLENIWLGRQGTVPGLALYERAPGRPTLAVLRYNFRERWSNVGLLDVGERTVASQIGFNGSFDPETFFVSPDADGNGAAQFTLFGRSVDTGRLKAETRDERSFATARNTWLWPEYRPLGAAYVGAIPGVSASAGALLVQEGGTDGPVRVVIMDITSGARLFELEAFPP